MHTKFIYHHTPHIAAAAALFVSQTKQEYSLLATGQARALTLTCNQTAIRSPALPVDVLHPIIMDYY